MAEAKKSAPKKSVPTPAADKRKAADDALEARIAARKAAKPVEPSPTNNEQANEPPFVPDAPKAEKPAKVAKEKKVAKPREAKPKAEVPAVSDLVAKIEAKVSAKLEKVHDQQLKATNKNFLAEVKRLNTEHKESMKNCMAQMADARKKLVAEAEMKAYAVGFRAGEKAANKAITAALKGR